MTLQAKKMEYLTLPCCKPYQHGGRADFWDVDTGPWLTNIMSENT
jgi:hypothetical protein